MISRLFVLFLISLYLHFKFDVMEFNTPYNYSLIDEFMEFNDEPSLTVPDMSYTIQELVEKFVSGADLSVSRPISYDGDDVDFSDLLTPDRIEGGFDLSDLPLLEKEIARLRTVKVKSGKSSQNVSDGSEDGSDDGTAASGDSGAA